MRPPRILLAAVVVSALSHGACAQDVLDSVNDLPEYSIENSDALLRLGDYFSEGTSGQTDFPKALQYYRQAADLGRSSGALRIAEMTIAGQGTTEDVPKGLAMLQTLADEDYPAALVALGKIYVSGLPGRVEADPEQGFSFLRRAAAFGDPAVSMMLADLLIQRYGAEADAAEVLSAYQRAADHGRADAFLRIGDFWTSGDLVAVDLSQGFEAYENAADADSSTGKLRMAEMLARGQGVAADVAKGLGMIRDEAALGNNSAMLLLAKVLVSGDVGEIEGEQALAHLKEAAATGRADALLRIAEMYRSGIGIPGNSRLELQYLELAAAEGIEYAHYLVALGMIQGRFSRAGSADAGISILEQALAGGMHEAAVGLSNAHLYGLGFVQDVEAALALLEAEAAAGNLPAARRLVELHRDGSRDGRRILIPQDAGKARAQLAAIYDRLDRSERLIQSLLLESSTVRSGDFGFVYERINELGPDDQGALLRGLMRAAPNAYVYLVQKQLTQLGYFNGSLNSQLNRATISAMLRYCEARQVGDLCRRGPLTPATADIMALAF